MIRVYFLGSHKMKGTVHALFTVAVHYRMCYEIFCNHIHNRVDHFLDSTDNVYNRGNHIHNLVLQTGAAGETQES